MADSEAWREIRDYMEANPRLNGREVTFAALDSAWRDGEQRPKSVVVRFTVERDVAFDFGGEGA